MHGTRVVGVRTPADTERPGAALATRASRTVIATFGAIVSFAGIEHGVGEILQGAVAPSGLVIESWPDTAAFEILAGEPALTVIPNLLVAGIASILVALLLGAWSVAFVGRLHGGLVLIGLSVLLLLVGGGMAPPLMGVILGVAATRIGASLARPPSGVARTLAPLWPWGLGIGVISYLALVPGMVLASALFRAEDKGLVIALSGTAFLSLVVALVAARAADRLAALRAHERRP